MVGGGCFILFSLPPQSHGHSHYSGTDCYSPPDGDVEEGEREKLQRNGQPSNVAMGKVDAGEGELMLSPAQTPEVTASSYPVVS